METTIIHKNKYKRSLRRTRQLSKLKRKFLEYFAHLPIQKLAAESIGKSEDTICDWKNNDTNFANQLARTKSEWVLNNVRKIKRPEWLLERIMSEYFGEKKEMDMGVNLELEATLDRIRKILPP